MRRNLVSNADTSLVQVMLSVNLSQQAESTIEFLLSRCRRKVSC